jgi:hypothetical protein
VELRARDEQQRNKKHEINQRVEKKDRNKKKNRSA